jgi:hypothetical protein
MTTAKFPTASEFKAGQEYVFSTNVHELDGARFELAAAFRVTYQDGAYVLAGNFATRQPSDTCWQADYLPHEANVLEEFSTWSRAKSMAAFYRQKSRYCAQVLVARPAPWVAK